MSDDTSWGIEPVPERLRVLGGFDLGLLWGNLGVSLLVDRRRRDPRPGALAPRGARRDRRRLPGRQPDARDGRADRRAGPRARRWC